MNWRLATGMWMAGLTLCHASWPELDSQVETPPPWSATESHGTCWLRSPSDLIEWRRGSAGSVESTVPKPLRESQDANARVALAMFAACMADKQNPRPLPAAQQAAIVTGPQAPRFLEAQHWPERCTLQSTYLLGDEVNLSFDVRASGGSLRLKRVASVARPKMPGLRIDLAAVGGPKVALGEGVEVALTPEMTATLRAALISGETRFLTASAGKKYAEPFAFGSRVNDTAVAMFDACLAARGL